jgi:hypothetical protein
MVQAILLATPQIARTDDDSDLHAHVDDIEHPLGEKIGLGGIDAESLTSGQGLAAQFQQNASKF